MSESGLELAGYREITQIGQGGLGTVYRAQRESTGGAVAVKELRDIAMASPAWHRARRELDAMLRLKGHPFVVSVEEIVDGPNGPCIVMEYVPGGSLYERVAFGPLTGPEIVLVGQQVAQALAAAHEEGIVHRDVKPHNLLVGSFGQVKVCDFGIASLVRGPDGRTQTQALTLGYASPEELDGDTTVGPPADVYSFGATMVHLLTGRKPSFQDRMAGAPVALGLNVSDPVLASVVAVLERCLNHRAIDRPTMLDVVSVFDSAAYQLGTRRLTRLDAIDPDDQRTIRRTAVAEIVSQPVGYPPSPGSVPAVVPLVPVSSAGFTFVTPPTLLAPVDHFQASQPFVAPPERRGSPRGMVWILLGMGAVLAVCVGVIVGVLADDRSASSAASQNTAPLASLPTTVPEPVATAAPITAVPSTAAPLTVAPVATLAAPITAAPTLPPAPVTAAPPLVTAAPEVAAPLAGDLFLSRPMTQPLCDGSYITLFSSAVKPEQWATGMQDALDVHPLSQYLLTEATCPSLTPRLNGNQIYSAYLGPFATKGDACAARDQLPEGAYIRILDFTTPYTVQQTCG